MLAALESVACQNTTSKDSRDGRLAELAGSSDSNKGDVLVLTRSVRKGEEVTNEFLKVVKIPVKDITNVDETAMADDYLVGVEALQDLPAEHILKRTDVALPQEPFTLRRRVIYVANRDLDKGHICQASDYFIHYEDGAPSYFNQQPDARTLLNSLKEGQPIRQDNLSLPFANDSL
jgi:flagella basal body P-ring formation protein FlgA